jgi:amino acid adenylation domain-containing protein
MKEVAAASQYLKEKDYWLNKLSGEPEKSNFYYDFKRKDNYKRRFDKKTFGFHGELFTKLIHLSNESDHRLHMVLVAGLIVLIGKYTGRSDIIIGTSVYKQDVVRKFINTVLVLRNQLDGNMTFKELLLQVRQTIIDAVENVNYPLEVLLKQLNLPSSNDDDFPLFDIGILLENIHDKKYLQHINHNITFSLVRKKDCLEGEVEYNSLLYHRKTIEQMITRFITIFQQVLYNVDFEIADIDILSDDEKRRVLYELNDTETPYPADKTIHGWFEEQVERTPGKTAVCSPIDLSDIFTAAGCFKKNPFIYEFDMGPVKLMKNHRHHSVVVNTNAAKLIDCFNGKRNLEMIFNRINNLKDISFIIYLVRQGDLLEITHDFNYQVNLFTNMNFEDFTSLVKLLHENHLIQCTGVKSRNSEDREAPWGDFEQEERFEFDETTPLMELLDQNQPLSSADVLLLGDTPGMPSTGLLYIASFLKRNRVNTYCHFYDNASDYRSMKRNIGRLLERIRPKIVAISLKWFPYIARVLDMCRIVKAFSEKYVHPVKIVVGGNTASYYWQDIIKYELIDYVIRGDGELPLLKICKNEPIIPNCVYKKDGEIIKTPITFIKDKTNSPGIYLSHLDEVLISPLASLFGTFFIYTHLGCQMNCCYCGGCHQVQKKTFNRKNVFIRPVQEVRKDIIAAMPYTSTLQFDFYMSNQQLVNYCRKIWDGIHLSSHFCVFSSMGLPSSRLLELVTQTFKYVYCDIDITTLSERHRLELASLDLVKPQPTDHEILTFFDQCENYENIEVRVNVINGLPCFSPGDIEAGEKFFSHIMHTYTCFSELHWARLHAQPGAPIVENAEKYDMHAYASTFDDFFEYSKKNFNSQQGYQRLEYLNYPYIYFHEDILNSKITRHYSQTNQRIYQYKKNQRNYRIPGDNITYGELNQESNQLARLLRTRGVTTDTIVAVMLSPSIKVPLAILAVLKAGGGYLPIDPEYPEERTRYILEDSRVSQVITQGNLIGKIPQGSSPESIIDIQEPKIYECQAENTNLEYITCPTDIVYTIYTSGTSGKPKGVILTHRNLVNYTHWFAQKTRLTPDDKTLLTSSFAFDLGYTSLFPSLLNGVQLHIIPKENYLLAEKLLNYLRWHQISYLKVTPSLFSVILQSPGFSASNCRFLRLVVMGGEPINPKHVEKAHQICSHIEIINHYGPTEATIGSVAQFIDFDRFQEYKKKPTIGKPINNSNVYIIDKNAKLLPSGVPGELALSGACLARGYLNRVELTSDKFLENPHRLGERIYRTGDLARFLPGGNVEFLGRIDNQVKIRGYRIELGEIENQLLKHQRIKDAIVITAKKNPALAADDNIEDKYICAYIVPKKEEQKKEKRTLFSLKEIAVKENLLESININDSAGYKKEQSNRSIVTRFENQLKRYKNKVAVKSDHESLTYEQLNQYSTQIAHIILKKYNDRNKLSRSEKIRYQRQMLLHGWGMESQEKLKGTTVFVAGAGGGASPAITQLALAGFGTLIVCDCDNVELSNLNRQFLHDESRIGMNKALSAKMTIEKLNPGVNVIPHTRKLTRENVFELVGDSEVIIDMFDDLASKFILSECAVVKKIPHIISAMTDINAYAAVFHTPQTPCFHCIFEKNKLEDITTTMKKFDENYRKKPLPVVAASLFMGTGFAVNETIKIILGFGNLAYNKYFLFNQRKIEDIIDTDGYRAMTYLYSDHFRELCKEQGFNWEVGGNGNLLQELKIKKNPNCPVCGAKGKRKLLLHPRVDSSNIKDSKEPIAGKPKRLLGRRDNEFNSNEHRVALLLGQNADMVKGIIGVLKSGKIYVPLNPHDPEVQLCSILDESEARLILTNNDNLNLAQKIRDSVNKSFPIVNVSEINGYFHRDNLNLNHKSNQTAYILYYKDPTGMLKNIPQTHDDVLEFINLYPNQRDGDWQDSVDAAMMDIYRALLNGDTYIATNHKTSQSSNIVSELKAYLSRLLPEYMIPMHFVQLLEMPLTPNGKIDKKALPEPTSSSEANRYIPPGNEIEEKLVEIWSEVLGIEKNIIGIDNNFFELGGHSLKVTILISKLQSELDVTLSFAEIFTTPTIRELAQHIGNTGDEHQIPIKKDRNSILLKRGVNEERNLFLVHGGGGEAMAYGEFCNHINNEYNCWGIQADRFEDYTPIILSIPEVAEKYIKTIKKIQPHGPYNIAGWCIGGSIAFEMVRQLELMEENVEFLAVIDSPAPHEDLWKNTSEFTLESELKWLTDYLTDDKIKEEIAHLTHLRQLWQVIVDYLEKTNFDVQRIRELIPGNMAGAIPNYDQLGRKELIYYFNVIRIFANARALYIPPGKINTPIHYFGASESVEIIPQYWTNYCQKPLKMYEVRGSHSSIFKIPQVAEFAGIFDNILNRV